MKYKIFLLALCAFFCSLSVKAQIGTAYYLNENYSHHQNTPLVRYCQLTNITISYFEKSTYGVFVITDQTGSFCKRIDLPTGHYVYDFEILGDYIYFCGEKVNSSASSNAFIGSFDFVSFVNGIAVPMDIEKVSLPRDQSRLNKMIAYYMNQTLPPSNPIVMAVGYGEDNGTVNNNGINFFIAKSPNQQLMWLETFPTERYHDIIATKDYIVLVGARLFSNFNNTIAIKKIKKSNPLSNDKDILYHCSFPHPEPLTFVVGEDISGTNEFVISSFATIDGINGTILRRYKAETMEEINSQFIPSLWGKTQPHELKHILGTDKLLLVQSGSNSDEPLIIQIDYNVVSNYTSIAETYKKWAMYSIDRHDYPKYIAIGHSANNPVFLVNDINSSAPCITLKSIDIIFTPSYPLSSIQDPMGNSSDYTEGIPNIYTFSNTNYTITCP